MIGNEAWAAKGGDVGVLLIHGFSGGPDDLRPLAEALADQGYTVDLPLLPGHGPTPDRLGTARWHMWTGAVASAHMALRRTCRQVVVVGYSMGGALAIYEAAREVPAGLVLLAVPTHIAGDWRVRLLPIAKYIVRWWYPFADANFGDPVVRASILRKSPELDLDDLAVQADLRQRIRIPTAAIDQFLRITRRARRLISRIDAPVLILQGRRDQTALPICAEEIYQVLGTTNKQLMWLDHSGHQLVDGPEGGAVIAAICQWIETQVGLPHSVPIDQSQMW